MENLESQKEIIDYISNITITDDITEEEVAAFYGMLKETLDNLLLHTVRKCWFLVKEHPITDVYSTFKGKIQEPETIRDYQKLLNNVKATADRVKRNIKFYDKGTTILGESLSDFAAIRDKFSDYVTQLIFFANASVHLQDSANKSNPVYLREVVKTLPTMGTTLKKAESSVEGWEKFGKGYDKIHSDALEFFLANSRVICDCVKSIQEREAKKQAEEESKKPKVEYRVGKKFEATENPAEIERKSWIRKANSLYEEFCLDFLRDLQKQYSQSTKDLYEQLVAKFEKFQRTFNMPLGESSDVSTGRAKEAYGQIQKFIESVSEISSASYTISVFGNNE